MSSEGLAKRSFPDSSRPDDQNRIKTLRRLSSYKRRSNFLPTLFVAIALPLICGALNAFFFSPNQPFYRQLKKPFWNPPGWLFGLAWSLFYPTMGLASWLVWVEGGWRQHGFALGLYSLQLTLNLMWPAIFFGLHDIGLALIEIIALLVVLSVCIGAFNSVNHVAANLLKIYLAWVIYATVLTYSLWMKNKNTGPLLKVQQEGLNFAGSKDSTVVEQ